MSRLSAEGQRLIEEVSARHGFDREAVRIMLEAVAQGQGSQAQFNHPAFGGMGQWSQGGMTMVGDMFNHGLKNQVDALCQDLSRGLGAASVFEPGAGQSQSQSQGTSHGQSQSQGSGSGFSGSSLFVADPGTSWPEDLGRPASQGAQNDMRYAFFPDRQRLAISVGGKMRVYDTKDHRIGGFGQAQGGGQSLSFTSQHGLVHLDDLRQIDGDEGSRDSGARAEDPRPAAQDSAAVPGSPTSDDALTADHDRQPRVSDPRAGAAVPGTPQSAPTRTAPETGSATLSDEQIFARLERLADFHARGIVDDGEFAAKKAELLARL